MSKNSTEFKIFFRNVHLYYQSTVLSAPAFITLTNRNAMEFRQQIIRQFSNPSGMAGTLAGYIMSYRKSNLERNKWATEVLKIIDDDHILEIGFGPGIAIKMMSNSIVSGTITGIDHSEKMLEIAIRRNMAMIDQGKVSLYRSSVSAISQPENKFDKVLAVNSFQFWENQARDLIHLRSLMSKNSVIALVYQPRNPDATDEDAFTAGKYVYGNQSFSLSIPHLSNNQ